MSCQTKGSRCQWLPLRRRLLDTGSVLLFLASEGFGWLSVLWAWPAAMAGVVLASVWGWKRLDDDVQGRILGLLENRLQKKRHRMTISLICPHDHQKLVELSAHFECTLFVGAPYQIDDGVICMLDEPDQFYEGAYENQVRFVPRSEKPWHVWPLWLINSGYPWMVRRHVAQGSTLVELGCAGGVRYFGKRYRAIGCDLSLSSLKRLDMYECRVQADAATCIPLPDSSVDAVVSSYFWEHIPPQLKPAMLQECQRILRPGGKIIFLYDVETRNPLIRRYKAKSRKLYDKLFIEGDGHLGYQWPSENIDAFKSRRVPCVGAQGDGKNLAPVSFSLRQTGRIWWARAASICMVKRPWKTALVLSLYGLDARC